MKKYLHFSFRVKPVVGYAVIAACMALMNFALPQREPIAFPLFFASITCGLNPLVCGAAYLISSAAALSLEASLCCAVQTAFLLLIAAVYGRMRRKIGWERVFYCMIAQLPFVFLFPHTGYSFLPIAVIWQKVIFAAFLFLLSFLFEGGLSALLFRAFRCRLSAVALAELGLMWLFFGVGLQRACGDIAFTFFALFALTAAALLLKNAAAVPFAVVLSLPLCFVQSSMVPCAVYAVYACLALLFCPYGKVAAALAVTAGYVATQFFYGLYNQSAGVIVLTLAACAVPTLLLACIPEKFYKRAKSTLLFYRERTLPRIAINRNRRAVGEQLYEVSALFREIENAFSTTEDGENAAIRIREKLMETLCTNCPSKKRCDSARIYDSIDKLIAVGCAKGHVNLIDLPADLSSLCGNSAGLLFALNKQLEDFRRYTMEMDNARMGRKLLAEQARGVSDVLRDIALEQSEEIVFSEGEHKLSAALAAAGILSSEIFLYGEGASFTVSLTVQSDVNGKRLCEVAERALGVPLSFSEKIPLISDRVCCILKRKPRFDAAFGVAAVTKAGEVASGDTHSVVKIDERRFLVALSDGMGSGNGARAISDRTLSLIESFYKAKMPSDTVLATVNRLISYSAEEMFSCIDLASVNLDSGIADIVKIGSPVGFVLSEGELRMLEGESLPLGMLEAIHPATLRVEMKEDDFLLFMSDGITSAFGSSTDLCAYLSALRPLNPQSLAEEVLDAALQKYNGTAEDDMTVLAVKLMAA